MICIFNRYELVGLPVLNLPEYAACVLPLAREIERQFGIPAAYPLIQSAHESKFGNSGLARKGMNLFGIKATESWVRKGGAVINMKTGEFMNGHYLDGVPAGFRAYESWMASFEDWALLISGLAIYAKAYELMKGGLVNFDAAARELGKYYATDPNYADKLASLRKLVRL